MTDRSPQTQESFIAFISYSHKDAQWGRWVQRELERYRLPADFATAQGLERKLGKVFRDREELPTGQNLGEHLTRALDNSKNLIVICSAQAKESPWVAKEIDYFKALGKGHRIFCLLVEGGSENFPTPLLTDLNGNLLEPLAADPRESGDGKRLAKLKLISGLVDTNLDQLARREYARRQRQFLGWSVVAFALITVTGGLAGAAYFFDQQRAAEVARNVETATRLSARIEEAYDYLDKTSLEINAQIISEYLDDIDDSELTSEQQVAIASTLRTQGNAAYRLGKVEKALTDLQRSRQLYKRYADKNPNDIDAAIEDAFADFYYGITHYYEGDHELAKVPVEQYARKVSDLYARAPDHPVLFTESVYAPVAVLSVLNAASDRLSEELENATKTAVAAANSAIRIAPDDREIIDAYNLAMDHSADAYMKSCRVFDALPLRQNAVVNARRALHLDPKNREYKDELANVLTAQGDSLLNSLQVTEGIKSYLEAIEIYEELLASDPENRYQANQLQRTKIVLLAIATYYPEISAVFPLVGHFVSEVKDPNFELLLESDRLLLLYFAHMADSEIIKGSSGNFEGYNKKYLNIAKRHDDPELVERYKLIYNIRKFIFDRSQNISTDEPAALANSPQELASESCGARQQRWNRAILSEDDKLANQIATELWALGARGTDVAFKSRMLGIPYPPESENP